MSVSSSTVTVSLEQGPAAVASGNGFLGFGVSLLLHLTVVLIGVTIGEPEVVRLRVRPGNPGHENQLVIDFSVTKPMEILDTSPSLGIPESQEPQLEPVEPPMVSVSRPMAFEVPETEMMGRAIARPAAGTPDATEIRESDTHEKKSKVAEEEPANRDQSRQLEASPVDASDQPEGVEADRSAKPLPANSPPEYPAEANREGREGRVVLRVDVGEEGTALSVSVMRSSGHSDLDQAAVTAVCQWRFSPGTRRGKPIRQTIAIPVRFVHDR